MATDEQSDDGHEDGHDGGQMEMRAGHHVKNQLLLWDTLLEWRIRMQKLLISSNSLPQVEYWNTISHFAENDLQSAQNQAVAQLKRLSSSLRLLMSQFFENDACLFSGHKDNESDDQSISSHSDADSDAGNAFPDESDEQAGHSDEENDRKGTDMKRKSDGSDDVGLNERVKRLRDEVMDEWYHKTRYSTSSSKKGSESSDQPPSIQIRQIMSDEKRLLRRTQLRRSQMQVIGKSEVEPDESRKQQNYDPECFDDDDFYHQLLRELIESKSASSADSMSVSRKWLEIQQLRNRMKKKVDTRASKGRKIRYQIHQQLLNFMAPVHTFDMTDEAKDELFSSLFQ